jgi:anti-sigma regulatory factor (Ser/Thr protein kinase)
MGMFAVKEGLNESLPAVAASVPRARALVAEFAHEAAGLDGARLDSLRLAVSEAVTNVVVHAYRGRAGTVKITGAIASDELWVLISDSGCGYQTPSERPGLGWGLVLMADACDDFGIFERADGGTEVRLQFVFDEPAAAV